LIAGLAGGWRWSAARWRNITWPVSGRSNPVINRNTVDFPQPLGPIRTVVVSGST